MQQDQVNNRNSAIIFLINHLSVSFVRVVQLVRVFQVVQVSRLSDFMICIQKTVLFVVCRSWLVVVCYFSFVVVCPLPSVIVWAFQQFVILPSFLPLPPFPPCFAIFCPCPCPLFHSFIGEIEGKGKGKKSDITWGKWGQGQKQ